MSNISSWTTSAAGNNSASPDGFPEGMAPSGVNDSAREGMGAVRRWYIDAEWINHGYVWVRQSANSLLVSITATDVFTAGRRLRMIDGGVTIYGDVVASSMSGANTLVTVSSSALSSSLSSGSVAIIDPINSSLPHMNALTTTTSVTASDYIEIFQSGTGLRRRALRADVVKGGAVLATEQATTAGTSINFTGIPTGVQKITIMFVGVSTNGTSDCLLQIGDSGGLETSGYTSAAADDAGGDSSTAGFVVNNAPSAATYALHGSVVLSLEDSTNNTWTSFGVLMVNSGSLLCFSAGSKSLSAVLDRISLTTVNGTDTFDAGAVNIMYE